MQFRKLGSGHFEAFDPEQITVLERAYHRAWNFIKQSGDAADMDETAAREEMAVHVIAVAEQGEDNVLRVTNLAIQRFRLDREKMRAALRRQARVAPFLKLKSKTE